MCIDGNGALNMNKLTIKDKYPLPRMYELLDTMAGGDSLV